MSKRLPVKDITAVSQEQGDGIIGTRLVFTPTCARSGDRVLGSPVYSVKVLSDTDFFSLGSFVELKEIGVRARHVTEVETNLPGTLSDLDFLGADVYLREMDIVIEVEGAYFVAERSTPGDTRCNCEWPSPKGTGLNK